METYRWSPEVERQFLYLVEVGCAPAIIAEQIGCSYRTAARRIKLHRDGQPQIVARPVRRPDATKGEMQAQRFAALSEEKRALLRSRAITNAAKGWDAGRIADALKLPVGVVREWVAEWGSGLTESIKSSAPEPIAVVATLDDPPWWANLMVWPKVTMREADWPADARFEDDPRACRPEPFWVPSRTISDRMSYCSNATSWAVA